MHKPSVNLFVLFFGVVEYFQHTLGWSPFFVLVVTAYVNRGAAGVQLAEKLLASAGGVRHTGGSRKLNHGKEGGLPWHDGPSNRGTQPLNSVSAI